eukprot:superscaffoldBa00000623_g6138
MVVNANNVSLSMDDQKCLTLQIGIYANLIMATQQMFGPRFCDEFSVLLELRSSQKEESSVMTLLNSQHHIHLQLRLGPHSLTFISTQHREYEYVWFPVRSMCDGQWHQVSLGVSTLWLEVYVDCWLVERVNWAYPWQGISTDGLLMVGGSLEGFETPFENLRSGTRPHDSSNSAEGSADGESIHRVSPHFILSTATIHPQMIFANFPHSTEDVLFRVVGA